MQRWDFYVDWDWISLPISVVIKVHLRMITRSWMYFAVFFSSELEVLAMSLNIFCSFSLYLKLWLSLQFFFFVQWASPMKCNVHLVVRNFWHDVNFNHWEFSLYGTELVNYSKCDWHHWEFKSYTDIRNTTSKFILEILWCLQAWIICFSGLLGTCSGGWSCENM